MTGPAWIFALAWLATSGAFVIVNADRQMWQDRAVRRQSVISELMVRHAALILWMRAKGYPVPDIEVIDDTDIREARTPADLLRAPRQREGL